jgi:hypothetical protein
MSLLGQENERPKCLLLHLPCRDGGFKSGIESHEAEKWIAFKSSL